MTARRLGTVMLLAMLIGGCAGRRPRSDVPPVVRSASANAPASVRERSETSRPQAERYRQNQDGEADAEIDVSTIQEPVPQDEPHSRYGNRSPYRVLGRSYEVLPSAKGYVGRGTASWYGKKFHGYMTSSFEPYDMYKFSAAHKSLPLPSWAKVTNLQNGKSVIVRVNDRGPFHDDRLIDLSYAAAVRIGVWPKGTAPVEVRAIMPGPQLPRERRAGTNVQVVSAASEPENGLVAESSAPSATVYPPSSGAEATADDRLASRDGHIYLQVGSYGDAANAERVAQQIVDARLGPVSVTDVDVRGQRMRRVRVGPLKDAESADRLAGQLRQLGLGHPRIAVD